MKRDHWKPITSEEFAINKPNDTLLVVEESKFRKMDYRLLIPRPPRPRDIPPPRPLPIAPAAASPCALSDCIYQYQSPITIRTKNHYKAKYASTFTGQ